MVKDEDIVVDARRGARDREDIVVDASPSSSSFSSSFSTLLGSTRLFDGRRGKEGGTDGGARCWGVLEARPLQGFFKRRSEGP